MLPSKDKAITSLTSVIAIIVKNNLTLAALSSGMAWLWASDLRAQRDAVLADPEMSKSPSKKGSILHHLNDVWPRFLEIANGQRGHARAGEEMVSKYLAWTALKAGFVLGVVVAIAAVMLFSSAAGAHEWYPLACCSTKDCKPYPRENVVSTKDGWKLHDGIVVPYDKARRSQDGQFHRCDTADGMIINLGKPCFFAPGAEG